MIKQKKRLRLNKLNKKEKKQNSRNRIIGMIAVVVLCLIIMGIIAAVVGLTDQKKKTEDSSGPVRPRLSFSYNGYEINHLNAFSGKMNMPLMRDSATPVANGMLVVNLEKTKGITGLDYELLSPDGEQSLGAGRIDKPEKTENLDLAEILPLGESVLVLTVHSDAREWYFYARLVNCVDNPPTEAMDFIQTFHEKALAGDEGGEIANSIEPDETGDASTMQYVNIHSGIDQITWGRMSPSVDGEVSWEVKELNDVSVSVMLKYYVKCPNTGEDADETAPEDRYFVEEFFRVRHVRDGNVTYLLDYERKINQIFEPGKAVISGNKILLGIVPSDIHYKTFEKGQSVVFASASDIWAYNSPKNKFTRIYHYDGRFPPSKIRLISCEENGNVTFAVLGYMNTGKYEGKNGAFIFRYMAEEGETKEVMSILSDCSGAITAQNLGQEIYYNSEKGTLFALTDGILFRAEAETGRREIIAEGLSKSAYVVSAEGNIIAFSTADTIFRGRSVPPGIIVYNFDTGKETLLESGSGEIFKPLGFLKGDLIYGSIRTSDCGKTASGEELFPMYKVDIIDSDKKVKKNYQQDGVYILDAEVKENLVTFKQVKREADIFVPTEDDFITNNEKAEEEAVVKESYTTDTKRAEWSLVFTEALKDTAPLVKDAKINDTEDVLVAPWDLTDQPVPKAAHYYVYGFGKLQNIQEQAGRAIAEADACNGVVVSDRQQYIWERGNRDLSYWIEEKETELTKLREALTAGKTAVEAAQEIAGGGVLDLTGCTAEQLCYLMNRDRMVLAMPDADTVMILTGYNEQEIFYTTPDGEEKKILRSDLDKLAQKGGSVYISYVE